METYIVQVRFASNGSLADAGEFRATDETHVIIKAAQTLARTGDNVAEIIATKKD